MNLKRAHKGSSCYISSLTYIALSFFFFSCHDESNNVLGMLILLVGTPNNVLGMLILLVGTHKVLC